MNYCFIVFAALALYGCGDKNPTSAETSNSSSDSATTKAQYFPVMDFLRAEIAKADSLPVGMMRYRSSGTTNDSGYIERDEFRQLASEFVPPALNDSVFKREFKETSFIDKSTGSATFFYNTDNDNVDVKRVDVITEKTDTYDKVKSIYLERRSGNGDSQVTKKLFWKPERNFQVITQIERGADSIKTELIKVVWDNRE